MGGAEGVVNGFEPFLPGAESGDAFDEGFGVGVLGVLEDVFGVTNLHDFTTEHDGDLIAEAANDAEVVGNEQDAHLKSVSQ